MTKPDMHICIHPCICICIFGYAYTYAFWICICTCTPLCICICIFYTNQHTPHTCELTKNLDLTNHLQFIHSRPPSPPVSIHTNVRRTRLGQSPTSPKGTKKGTKKETLRWPATERGSAGGRRVSAPVLAHRRRVAAAALGCLGVAANPGEPTAAPVGFEWACLSVPREASWASPGGLWRTCASAGFEECPF